MDIGRILILFIIAPLLSGDIIEGFCGVGLSTECILLQLGLRWIPLGFAIIGLFFWIKKST